MRLPVRNKVYRQAVMYRGRRYVEVVAEMRPSLTGKGQGKFPVYSSLVYLSRAAHRGYSDATDDVQDLIEDLKTGDLRAIKEAASTLAQHPGLDGFRGVVAAAPRSNQQRPSNMVLARELVQLGVGTSTMDLIQRSKTVPSSRMRRRQFGPQHGTPYSEHLDTMQAGFPPQAAREGILIVDDIFTSGATLRAAAEVLWRSGFTGPVFGATAGYYQQEPTDTAVVPRVFYV